MGDKPNKRGGRGGKNKGEDPQNELNEIMAAAEHRRQQEAQEAISPEAIERAAAETQQQISQDAAEVLERQPASQPEATDAAVLGQNSEAVQGLAVSNSQEVAAVAETATGSTSPAQTTQARRPRTRKSGKTDEEIIKENAERLPNALKELEKQQEETWGNLSKKIAEERANTDRLINEVNRAIPIPPAETETPVAPAAQEGITSDDFEAMMEEAAKNGPPQEIAPATAPENIPTGGPIIEGPEIPNFNPFDRSEDEAIQPAVVPQQESQTKTANEDISEPDWETHEPTPVEPENEIETTSPTPETPPTTEEPAENESTVPPTPEATPTSPEEPPTPPEANVPETTPPTPETPAEAEPTTPAERNTVIRNIANQGILRERLAAEAAARGEILSEEQINELAQAQAEFVKSKNVEELIIRDSDRIKKIFKPGGKVLTQKELKQELLTTLLDKKSIANQKKLKLLARQISNETGLSMDQVEELINNQEQKLRDSALAEINAGRAVGVSAEDAAANAKSRRNKQIGWTIAKSVAYIGGGALLTGVTGGVGAIAALTGVRVIDRIITDRLQKRKVDAKFAEMKTQLENDPAQRDAFLQGLFTEVGVAQQKRISGEHNFNFEGFADLNPDLVAGYEGEDREQLMRALNGLQRIDQINYIRERDLLERMADKLRGKNIPGLAFMESVATGFNKFMVKGGENTYERAVSAAMLGGAAIAAREMPVIRNIMLAMAGWKAGDFAGRMIWGAENPELGKVDDVDTAQDILDTLAVMEENKTSDKHKRLLLKAGTSLLFASAPIIANQIIQHWPAHGNHSAQGGVNHEPLQRVVEKPTTVAEAAGQAVEVPKTNPLTEAITEMKGVHGNDSPHLWGLIDRKVDVMTEHMSGIADIKAMAGSEGRMTHIIDNIKDQIARNPQEFGLPKGANIDVLSHADLERISQNPHFNEVIAGMFKEGSFADQAQNLSEAAIRNIEANNDYYQGVASHLKGVRLDQAAYDTMDKMQGQGMSAEAAAQAMQQAHDNAAQHIAGATPISSSGVAETLAAETAKASPYAEYFQDEKSMTEWRHVWESMSDNNDHATSKSLDNIFRHLGIAERYSDPDTAQFLIKNTSYRGGVLEFDVPPPINHNLADQMGDIHFSYNPGRSEMMGYIGDEQVRLENVKNVDSGVKAIFEGLVDKINA